jgi:hypothetical protein
MRKRRLRLTQKVADLKPQTRWIEVQSPIADKTGLQHFPNSSRMVNGDPHA